MVCKNWITLYSQHNRLLISHSFGSPWVAAPITRGSLSPSSSSSSLSTLASSLTRSVFHSELEIWFFRQIISFHRPFLSYRTDSTDSRTIYCFYSAQQLDLFAWCVTLSQLSRLSKALKIIALSLSFYLLA